MLLVAITFAVTFASKKNPKADEDLSTWASFLRFFYACFLKPHEKEGGNGQQDALESFYKAQAGVYDATRKRLLCGREDMLGLVAAQLTHKSGKKREPGQKRIWVDVSLFEVFRDALHADLMFADWRRNGLQHRGHEPIRRGPRLLLQRLSRRFLPFAL